MNSRMLLLIKDSNLLRLILIGRKTRAPIGPHLSGPLGSGKLSLARTSPVRLDPMSYSQSETTGKGEL